MAKLSDVFGRHYGRAIRSFAMALILGQIPMCVASMDGNCRAWPRSYGLNLLQKMLQKWQKHQVKLQLTSRYVASVQPEASYFNVRVREEEATCSATRIETRHCQ
jgi:hypothetical protein